MKNPGWLIGCLLIMGCCFAAVGSAVAQPAGLRVHGVRPLTLSHRVAAGQNLYAIGRRYHVHPQYLLLFNKRTSNRELKTGDRLLIPLSDTNFLAKKSKGTPLFYYVQRPASLSGIANELQWVTTRELRVLNKLQGNRVSAKKKLLIGYLPTAPLLRPSTQIKNGEQDRSHRETFPVMDSAEVLDSFVVTSNVADSGLAVRDTALYRFLLNGQGYFKAAFDEQVESRVPAQQLARAALFKTQSGFDDQKYYVITNLAQPGTFVYLYADQTGRGVYAKVIGELSSIRLNEGLDLRMSNAAAAALGMGSCEKCSLTFYFCPAPGR